MKKIYIQNEYLLGPLWYYDEENDEAGHFPFEPFDIIKNDEKTMQLVEKIGTLYDSYFDFDTLEIFIEQREIDGKEEMLSYISELKKRLDEINDGSFVVIDKESEELLKL